MNRASGAAYNTSTPRIDPKRAVAEPVVVAELVPLDASVPGPVAMPDPAGAAVLAALDEAAYAQLDDVPLEDALRYADTVSVVATPTAVALFLPALRVPVHTDDDWTRDRARPLHVELLADTDLLLVAPATATTMAKAAQGLADTLLTALVLAHGPGVYFRPSMNHRMWESPAVRRNTATLRADGHHVLAPEPTSSLTDDTPGAAVGPIPGDTLAEVAAHATRRTG
ncbi:flavoprotein [Embleya sp. NPDC127516]|uniref:flavoprotein n=1 Tax=Embleya sp. NPDC127516 TaxID=3363990 RepID=UPI00382458B4